MSEAQKTETQANPEAPAAPQLPPDSVLLTGGSLLYWEKTRSGARVYTEQGERGASTVWNTATVSEEALLAAFLKDRDLRLLESVGRDPRMHLANDAGVRVGAIMMHSDGFTVDGDAKACAESFYKMCMASFQGESRVANLENEARQVVGTFDLANGTFEGSALGKFANEFVEALKALCVIPPAAAKKPAQAKPPAKKARGKK